MDQGPEDAMIRWERNCHTGHDIARLSDRTRIVRTGRAGDYLYSAEQWGDHSLRYPLRGSWCATLAEAERTLPAPLREAHTMPPEESLRYAIALILDPHFGGRFPEGADRLAGYLRRRVTDGAAPKVTRGIRETWGAFAGHPIPDTCDEIAEALLRDVKARCAERGLVVEALTSDALDAIEKVWA
jgi:hypothetical protein